MKITFDTNCLDNRIFEIHSENMQIFILEDTLYEYFKSDFYLSKNKNKLDFLIKMIFKIKNQELYFKPAISESLKYEITLEYPDKFSENMLIYHDFLNNNEKNQLLQKLSRDYCDDSIIHEHSKNHRMKFYTENLNKKTRSLIEKITSSLSNGKITDFGDDFSFWFEGIVSSKIIPDPIKRQEKIELIRMNLEKYPYSVSLATLFMINAFTALLNDRANQFEDPNLKRLFNKLDLNNWNDAKIYSNALSCDIFISNDHRTQKFNSIRPLLKRSGIKLPEILSFEEFEKKMNASNCI